MRINDPKKFTKEVFENLKDAYLYTCTVREIDFSNPSEIFYGKSIPNEITHLYNPIQVELYHYDSFGNEINDKIIYIELNDDKAIFYEVKEKNQFFTIIYFLEYSDYHNKTSYQMKLLNKIFTLLYI